MLLPVAFGASTFAVWMFSRFLFPVFLQRYFFPNMILHTIWLSFLAYFLFGYVTRSTVKYGLVLASALLTGLAVIYWPFNESSRIPCFDSSTNAYLEDLFKDDGPVVAVSDHIWLTRQSRLGEKDIFAFDKRDLAKKGTEYRSYAFQYHFVRRFAEWLGVTTVMSTEKLLNARQDFMVLDDQNGPWFKFLRLTHKLELTPLAEMKDCKLWRVKVLE